ncbi:hypothetical protein V502_10088, partial [Pseudogymnoascus sp. VKM F-4520 (FW-2644)]
MDYQTQGTWDRSHQAFPYNSMTASQADQQEASFPVDALHWIANVEPALRGHSHPDSQLEWAQTFEPPKAFNDMQNRQNQQYSYQEAHQNTYPAPQLLNSDLSYAQSSSFHTQWAPSPGADSRDSSALSPQSDRDFRHDPSIVSSPYAALPLTRSHSGISALSHETELWAGGGLAQTYQQTTANMAMIHREPEETPTFQGHEEMFMDHESGEQDLTSITVNLAPRPTHSHYLHPHASPAPSSIHRHVSPAPSSYSSHNPPAPRLPPVEAEDTDLDAAFDLDSLPADDLPAADDTDTDSTYTPHQRRTSRPTRQRRNGRRAPAPTTPLHPSTTTRVKKPSSKAPSSSTGRVSNANPTFPCTFAWAGCTSAFGSKNEWKRHVASKHICFNYWECHVGPCSAPGQGGRFNRKDLFAQHLRRMHSPGASAKSGPDKVEWEGKLAQLLEDGKKVGRSLIREVACPKPGCTESWKGLRAWDERMEHVARHWEE